MGREASSLGILAESERCESVLFLECVMERESDIFGETEAALGRVTEVLGSFGAAGTEDGGFSGIGKNGNGK